MKFPENIDKIVKNFQKFYSIIFKKFWKLQRKFFDQFWGNNV